MGFKSEGRLRAFAWGVLLFAYVRGAESKKKGVPSGASL